ncbi:MAG: cytochrome b/b6 domain-containing protein [Thiovulaceae bacterium]|nr:cytochrome b/b6 domain-containing protein [Sulfurimonadaceae bacterium]
MKNDFKLFYRIWHWTLAFSVIGLLLTVLLRKTFLSYKTNAVIIQDKLASLDVEVSLESAKLVGKAIRAPMWEWHYIFALFLTVAIVMRLFMLATKQAEHPLPRFLHAKGLVKLQTLVYLLISIIIPLMALSGGVLYFYEALGLTKADIGWIKETHELMMYGVIVLVGMHLAGVLRHEITTKEGIISKMIHGER